MTEEKKGKSVVIFILGIILTIVPLAVLNFPIYVDLIVIVLFNIPFFGKIINFAFWIWAVASVLVSGPELQHVWLAAALVLEIIFVVRPFAKQCGNTRKRAQEIGGKAAFSEMMKHDLSQTGKF